MTIVKKGIRIIASEVRFDTTDGKIHLRHLPCSGVRVLSKHRNVVDVTAVVFNEFRTLDEHAARAAAGVDKDAVFDTNRKSLLRRISAEKGLK